MTRTHGKSYDVFVYALVAVKCRNVTAETQLGAIAAIKQRLDVLHGYLHRGPTPGANPKGAFWVESAEYADEIHGYLVDEEGDQLHERTQYYDAE